MDVRILLWKSFEKGNRVQCDTAWIQLWLF